MANRPSALPNQPGPFPPKPTPTAPPTAIWPRAATPGCSQMAPAAVHEPTTHLPSAGGWIPTDPPPV